ncbi:MAG: hypothetical protein IT381_00035 [Deltaproteobacteria bacterium]|nr:hypothetical protein [Deltaproteobacteria bacterium]
MAMKKSTEATTETQTVTKSGRFDAGDWERFVKWATSRGTSEWDELRYLIRNRLSGHCVVLTGFKPESLIELEEYADELGIDTEQAVRMVLINFLTERRKAKKR